jgi:predicted amidophosphoribosyltransferase
MSTCYGFCLVCHDKAMPGDEYCKKCRNVIDHEHGVIYPWQPEHPKYQERVHRMRKALAEELKYGR